MRPTKMNHDQAATAIMHMMNGDAQAIDDDLAMANSIVTISWPVYEKLRSVIAHTYDTDNEYPIDLTDNEWADIVDTVRLYDDTAWLTQFSL